MSQDEPKGWSADRCAAWYGQQPQVRDYVRDVVERARAVTLPPSLVLSSYGAAHGDDLICVAPRAIDSSKPSLSITGGVHGYEPSGIDASLQLIETGAQNYRDRANIFIFPCVTPAAYRIHHRWTHGANDTNREFFAGTNVIEAALLMQRIESLGVSFTSAIDCHETPIEDRLFRRLRADRYGTPLTGDPDLLPDGFHMMVPDTALLRHSVQECARTLMDAVARITPIATDELIVGNKNDRGVIPSSASGTLTRWMSARSDFAATTEVVTENISARNATRIQLTAIQAAADYMLKI